MTLDLLYNRISNRFLIINWFIGLTVKLFQKGIQGLFSGIILTIIPFILLIFLYQIRALGAGDIKLYGAIAAFLTLDTLIEWIVFSFVCGAVLGIWILVSKKLFRKRFCYMRQYIKDQIQLFPSRRIYQEAHIGQENVIHFTVPMLVGYCLLLMKGSYI